MYGAYGTFSIFFLHFGYTNISYKLKKKKTRVFTNDNPSNNSRNSGRFSVTIGINARALNSSIIKLLR